MQTLAEIRELLESRGLAPRKLLGQNFLIDQNLIRKLVEAAEVKPGDLVLEIGPGTGTLTEELLGRGGEVVACELDRGLAQLLRERLGEAPAFKDRFTLVEGDALATKRQLNPELVRILGGRPFKLVANLPYGAATPVMLALLVEHPECEGLFVTIQREVADRLLAQPGTKEYGPLTVIASTFAEVRRIAVLPPECFWPRPDVTSAMVGLRRRERSLLEMLPETSPGLTPAGPGGEDVDPRRVADAVQQLFSRRRKQLGSLLGRNFEFPKEITPKDRIETLSVEQVVALARRMG